MKALRPRVLQVAWWCVCCLLVLHLYCLDSAWAQAPAAQTLGSLRATGEVYLNGLRATGEQTLFPGDTVRTGPDAAAALTSPGFGLLIIPAQSELSFRAPPYLATLKHGSVEVRSFQPSRDLGIQFGNTVMYLPSPETESAAAITLRADGSARVACGLGSAGIRSVDGTVLAVLHSNQAVEVDADGKSRNIESVVVSPDVQISSGPATAPVAAAKSSRIAYVGLAVIAGGTAAVIALLAGRSNRQPVSPSVP
jgi:hypothetical protein